MSFCINKNECHYNPYIDPFNGHDYVDLGLPSGLLWATTNVGATNPEDDGLYFAWGETEGYNNATERNAATGGTGGFDQTSYDAGSAASIASDLTLAQDAANAYMGGDWRMPTKAECEELKNYTDMEYTTINGVYGRKFMKKADHSVYVFLPASGCWAGTSLSNHGPYGQYRSSAFIDSTNTYYLYFSNGIVSMISGSRLHGLTVRGVINA